MRHFPARFPALGAALLLVAACQRDLPGDDNLPAPDRKDPGEAVPSPEPEDPAAERIGKTRSLKSRHASPAENSGAS